MPHLPGIDASRRASALADGRTARVVVSPEVVAVYVSLPALRKVAVPRLGPAAPAAAARTAAAAARTANGRTKRWRMSSSFDPWTPVVPRPRPEGSVGRAFAHRGGSNERDRFEALTRPSAGRARA